MDGHDGLLALFSHWDDLDVPLSLGELRNGLNALAIRREDVACYVLFNDVAYQRVLIHRTPCYEALVLGWHSGQRSPIHDHRGSICGVTILDGVATETIFQPSLCGRLVPSRSRSAGLGTIWVSRDADVHQMANLGPPDQDLVSLHVYSPPLTSPRIYGVDETTLGGLDVSRPPTVTAKLFRADPAHVPSRIRPSRKKRVSS